MKWYSPLVVVAFAALLCMVLYLNSKLYRSFSARAVRLFAKERAAGSSLLRNVLLSTGSALCLVGVGMKILSTPSASWQMPMLASLMIFLGLFLCLSDANYEEEVVLLPFAAAGSLFALGNELTIGFGVMTLTFALLRFAAIKKSSQVANRHVWPVWFVWWLASATCVLVPVGIARLSGVVFASVSPGNIPLICGCASFVVGMLVTKLPYRAEASKK